ncbi:hypothetical protein SNEBB_004427 [Seison nebaliae]|nr:hypothetical protein SNEBB_004427 [Seison nebaliae]
MSRHTRINFTYLPIISFFLIFLSLIALYTYSSYMKNVRPILPFISDLAAKEPSRLYFGELLTIGAFFAFVMIYVRFSLIKHLNELDHQSFQFVNNVSLLFGIIICLGMTIVANFPENKSFIVHIVGAYSVFGGGWLYTLLQGMMTLKISRYSSDDSFYRVGLLQVCLSCLIAIFLIICTICMIFANKSWEEGHVSADKQHWSPEDGGYALHVTAATCEWLLITTLIAFFLTYQRQFNSVKFQTSIAPKVTEMDEENLTSPSIIDV